MKNAHTSRSIAQNVILDWTRKLRNNFFRRLTELRKFPMRCSEKNATIFRTISFNCDVSITDIITSNGQNLITNELQEMYVSHGFHHLALNRFHSFAWMVCCSPCSTWHVCQSGTNVDTSRGWAYVLFYRITTTSILLILST